MEEEHNYLNYIKEGLKLAGADPEAFDILDQEPIVLPSLISSEHGMACFAAVSKANGMIFLFTFKADKQEEESSVIVQ